MTKGELAKQIFTSGVNCSTSVALAFQDELDLTKEQIERLSIGFGGGFGRQRLVCGAVSGMTMVLSYLLSDGHDKLAIYTIIKEACAKFKAELGSVICAELLDGIVKLDGSTTPEARTPEYYKKRPCAETCQIAADVAWEIIQRERSK